MRRIGERGLATAVIRGWQAARGEILAVIDADLQHPPEVALSLLRAVDGGADLAVASRHVAGGGTAGWPLYRRALSRGAQLVGALLVPGVIGRVSDPMSGFFMVRRASVAGARMSPLGYKILVEVLARAEIRRIEEVGYVFQERATGASKVSTRVWVDYLRHLFRLSPAAGALLLVASLVLHLAVCAAISRQKPVWFDEVFTLYVAQLPDAASIWRALRGGMDNHPPISYWLSHYAMALVGDGPFGLRLPAMIGVWIGLVSLYRFVAARATAAAGAIAALLVASSVVMVYACEGRAYGLVFGASCVTLLAWQRCLAPERGRAAPLLLFVALSVTLWTHYYAVLVLAPLALAEGLRAMDCRAIDRPVALALLGGALNEAPLYWFAKANAGYSTHFWAPPDRLFSIEVAYEKLLGGLWLPVGAVLVLLAVLSWSRREAPPRPAQGGAARWELAAALGLLAVPCVMWVLAKLVVHAYYFRFGLITVIGAAILLGRGVALSGRTAQRLAVVVMVVLLPLPLLKLRGEWKRSDSSNEAYAACATKLADCTGLPVVFDGDRAFLAIYRKADARDASRFFALIDPEAEVRIRGYDTSALAFEGLQRFRDVHVREYKRFVAAHPRFVLLTRPLDGLFALTRVLEDPRAHVEFLALDGQVSAYLVTYPGAANVVVRR